MTLSEIVSQLKACGYRCEAGALELNTAFIELEKMAEKKAVIFDLGQVLVGYDPFKTFQTIIDIGSIEMAGALELFSDISNDLETGHIGLDGMYACYRRIGFNKSRADFAAAWQSGLSRIEESLAYATELSCRSNIVVGAISNTYEGHTDWLYHHVPELNKFEIVIFSCEVGMAKPNQSIYNLALKHLDVQPGSVIFIDDILDNVHGAKDAGLNTIHHANLASTRSLLEAWLNA